MLETISHFLTTAIPFLIVLGVVVTIHEYGHYIIARWRGVDSQVFSIGFGPKIFGWKDRRGTYWQVALIPLGGYVKFVGDANAASGTAVDVPPEQQARSFPAASVWSRMMIVAAGPIFNFVLSIVVFAGLTLFLGRGSHEPIVGDITPTSLAAKSGLKTGDQIKMVNGVEVQNFDQALLELSKHEAVPVPVAIVRDGTAQKLDVTYLITTEVTAIKSGSAAAKAGMRSGDKVLAINETPISSFGQIVEIVGASKGETLALSIDRAGQAHEFQVKPDVQEVRDSRSGEIVRRPLLGFRNISSFGLVPKAESVSVFFALKQGILSTYHVIGGSLSFLGEIFAGRENFGELGGPLQIASVSGQAAKEGVVSVLSLIAFISASIGFLNLMPIPVLDGGHLVFFIAEAVRGKPVSPVWVERFMTVGFVLLVGLMLFATYNDLIRA